MLRARVREIPEIARIAERAGEIFHEISVDESEQNSIARMFPKCQFRITRVSFSCHLGSLSVQATITGEIRRVALSQLESRDRESHGKGGAIATIQVQVAVIVVNVP